MYAQRTMDKLGRGLVATVTQSGSGNFVSWRVLGEEYYDVTYNLYAIYSFSLAAGIISCKAS